MSNARTVELKTELAALEVQVGHSREKLSSAKMNTTIGWVVLVLGLILVPVGGGGAGLLLVLIGIIVLIIAGNRKRKAKTSVETEEARVVAIKTELAQLEHG